MSADVSRAAALEASWQEWHGLADAERASELLRMGHDAPNEEIAVVAQDPLLPPGIAPSEVSH
eukprot:3207775-Karenia_brevis.AAC.1